MSAENSAGIQRIAELEAERLEQNENHENFVNDRVKKLELQLSKARATVSTLRESLASVKAKWTGPAESAQRKKTIAKLKAEIKALREQLKRKSEFLQTFNQKQKADNEREMQLR